MQRRENTLSAPVYFYLSNFYFWFFALLGGLAPYWSLYLESVGFSHLEIGQLLSILMITKVLAPNLWSWLGDRSNRRLGLVRWGAFLGCACFGLFFVSSGFWSFALVMLSFSFFWNAILPQYEVITLFNLKNDKNRYGHIRLWGSIGFILAVFLLGALLDYTPITLLPICLFIILSVIWVSTLAPVQEPRHRERHSLSGLIGILRSKVVIAFFVANLLLQVSHGAYYTFFSIYMESYGYSKTAIGLLWAEGVIAEVILFLLVPILFARYTLRIMMIAALVITTLRWLLTGWMGGSLPLIIVAQLGHAASFGLMHVVAIYFVHRAFMGVHEGQGQALYSAASFGAGGAIGALMSGYLATTFSLAAMFLVSALVAMLALSVAWSGFSPSFSAMDEPQKQSLSTI
ncbi:MAG: MFS transporter [Gammaproteobacteria bacterium]|nr:MAG: MFS transporter [Gammaproteobacteria bacterium]